MALPRSTLCCLAALLALAAAPARGDIYTCQKGGTTVYQNFTCDLDSVGSQSPSGKSEQARSKAATSTTASGAKESASASKGLRASIEPRIGMTAEEVRARWGDPANVYDDELVDGRVEIWSYDGSRAVHFNPRGRVVSVERAIERQR